MSAPPEAEPREPSAMDRLARELAALGAETRTERRVKRIVPWVASLVIHLGMATLAVFITWTVSNLPKKDDAVLIVADFNALNYEPVAGMESAPGQPAGPVVRDMAPPLPVAQHINDQLNAPDDQPLKDVAAALGYADESGVSALSRFAPRPGQNAAIFAGASGSNARRIVYVIDASGSMIAYLQIVVDELARSLENLSSRQSFGVVFFQADAAIQVPPAGELLPATADEKVRALKWIDANIVPAGGTNPVVAIDKALALKPNVIFLLSQDITGYGQFEVDQQDLLTMLDQRNPREAQTGRRAVQINCIQFLDHDPLETMAKIAKEHGGPNGYKFLTRKELGLGES